MLGSRKRNGLKIAFLNIVSLRKYKNELDIILHDNDIDIIGLSETRLDKNVQNCKLLIEGYKIFRNDRDANGGGVAIYVRDSIPEPTIELKSDKLELLSLRIKPKNARSFVFVCWYRPPTSVVDEHGENSSQKPLTTQIHQPHSLVSNFARQRT